MFIRLQKDVNASNCEVDEDMEHLELSDSKNALESLLLLHIFIKILDIIFRVCLHFSDDVDSTAFLNNASITTNLEGIVFALSVHIFKILIYGKISVVYADYRNVIFAI